MYRVKSRSVIGMCGVMSRSVVVSYSLACVVKPRSVI